MFSFLPRKCKFLSLESCIDASDLRCMGISFQRSTIILWDRFVFVLIASPALFLQALIRNLTVLYQFYVAIPIKCIGHYFV